MSGTPLSVAEVIDATARPILEFGRGWMLAKPTARRAAELGLPKGRGFWVCGRGGVLGDVDADVVAGAVGFMAPAALRAVWEARPPGLRAADCAAEYARCCATWSQEVLAGVAPERLRRLDELARVVADAANPTIGALFAGWRAMPRPDDPASAVGLSLQVLRELRGGAHIVAVLASGLSPMEAALAAEPPRGGEAWARDLGWSEPFPDPAGLGERRAVAEALTSQLCESAFGALPPPVRAEFVELVAEARAAAG